jgi:hypothetical protein
MPWPIPARSVTPVKRCTAFQRSYGRRAIQPIGPRHRAVGPVGVSSAVAIRTSSRRRLTTARALPAGFLVPPTTMGRCAMMGEHRQRAEHLPELLPPGDRAVAEPQPQQHVADEGGDDQAPSVVTLRLLLDPRPVSGTSVREPTSRACRAG